MVEMDVDDSRQNGIMRGNEEHN